MANTRKKSSRTANNKQVPASTSNLTPPYGTPSTSNLSHPYGTPCKSSLESLNDEAATKLLDMGPEIDSLRKFKNSTDSNNCR